ncbi:olfactory receptor 52N5-like [Nelusetta ayraudi]|uniref:olfactory receptor 52N5-like n=1 Tax=Nelusetta ayraudi TaxID=303726 RepID=UPI003F707DA8
MVLKNVTSIKNFVITGFPGLPSEYYGLMSVLLLLLYLGIVVGNGFVLAAIVFEKTLRKPTYWIFFHLAMTDVIFGTVTLPKIIIIYWWADAMTSSFVSCFTQMYFVHALSAVHSLMLMMMALDRFIAVLFPFRYPVVVTNKSITVACNLCWVLTFIRMMGIVFHALTLRYCNRNTILHCYCDHVSIVSLGCGEEVTYVRIVALGNAMVTLLVPLTVIILSYIFITIAALKMSQTQSRHKILSTCLPQLMVTCLYYVPRCFVYITNNLGLLTLRSDTRVVIAMMYSLIPAVVNPLIYCLKTKDIKETLTRRFKNKRIKILK